jgi:hypothetical protein
MADTINQHFVSRFYLNNFQIQPPSRVPRIWVYDKIEDRVFSSPIEKAGSENLFFEPHVEPEVTEIENIYRDNYAKLVERFTTGNENLQNGDIGMLALLVAFQWLRTPAFRSLLDIILPHTRQTSIDNFVNVENYTPKNAEAIFPSVPSRQVQADMLLNRETLMMFTDTIIKRFDWDVAVAPTGVEFITSDNPVAMSGRFLLDVDNQISLPLSVRIAVVLRLTGGKPVSRCGACELEYVKSVNFNCFHHAHRFIYASNRELLETTKLDALKLT